MSPMEYPPLIQHVLTTIEQHLNIICGIVIFAPKIFQHADLSLFLQAVPEMIEVLDKVKAK